MNKKRERRQKLIVNKHLTLWSRTKSEQKAFEKSQEIEKNYSNIGDYRAYNFKDEHIEFVKNTLKEMIESNFDKEKKLNYIADKIKKEFNFKWSKIRLTTHSTSISEIDFKRRDFIGSQPKILIQFKK